jgi:hypothetical protein
MEATLFLQPSLQGAVVAAEVTPRLRPSTVDQVVAVVGLDPQQQVLVMVVLKTEILELQTKPPVMVSKDLDFLVEAVPVPVLRLI